MSLLPLHRTDSNPSVNPHLFPPLAVPKNPSVSQAGHWRWGVLFWLDVVLLLFIRIGVATLGIDDGCICIRCVVCSFGFVCEVGTWGGQDGGQCHELDNSLLLRWYKRLKCGSPSHSTQLCKSFTVWPFTYTEHQQAAIFRLHSVSPHFPLWLAHENQGFKMILSVRKSVAHTFKLTLSSSHKKGLASHFKPNLQELFTAYQSRGDDDNILGRMRDSSATLKSKMLSEKRETRCWSAAKKAGWQIMQTWKRTFTLSVLRFYVSEHSKQNII